MAQLSEEALKHLIRTKLEAYGLSTVSETAYENGVSAIVQLARQYAEEREAKAARRHKIIEPHLLVRCQEYADTRGEDSAKTVVNLLLTAALNDSDYKNKLEARLTSPLPNTEKEE